MHPTANPKIFRDSLNPSDEQIEQWEREHEERERRERDNVVDYELAILIEQEDESWGN